MEPYTCYERYLAIKQHFLKWDYDYFEYGGRTRTSRDAFDKRPDKAQFYTLSRKKKPLDVLLGNLAYNPHMSVREMNQDDDIYLDYQRRVFSITYLFQNEITELDPVWVNNFRVEAGKHPLLIRKFLSGRVSHETASIALQLSHWGSDWRQQAEGDLFFNEIALRIFKYHRFLKYDVQKIRNIIVDYTNQDDKYMMTA